MHVLVQVEAAAVAKALAAFAVDIERLAGVGASVHAQLGSSGTALAAVLAAVTAVGHCCWARSCHTHCTRKACLQPLLMQQTW